MSDGMELFTKVKQTLKHREESILKLSREHELISDLCRNLLSSLSLQNVMRGNGMSYDESEGLKNDTKVLCSRIDSEVEVHNHCQEELMKYEKELEMVEVEGERVKRERDE